MLPPQKSSGGRDGTLWGIMSSYLGRFPGFLVLSTLIMSIIFGPLAIIGFLTYSVHWIMLLLVVPWFFVTMYLAVRLLVSDVSYTVERKSVIEAMRRSLYLTKSRFWYIFLRLFLFGIMAVIILFIVALIIGIPRYLIVDLSNLSEVHPVSILFTIISSVVNFYFYAAIACFNFLIFASLVHMKGKPKAEKPPEPATSVIQ
jgi:membrane-anchored glycerophosphoryl diester phosphodiesterase (GDPDase)